MSERDLTPSEARALRDLGELLLLLMVLAPFVVGFVVGRVTA